MKDFTKERLDRTNTLFELRGELDKETDRGCCLMAAGFLEEELRVMLATKLVGSKKFLDEVFEFNGPLGSFSARIKMSYALGFICKAAMHDLNTIRKIRNNFAHKHHSISFSTESLKKEIYKLKGHFYESGISEPRKIFTNCTVGLVSQIHNALFHAPSFTELQDFPLPSKKILKLLSEDPERTVTDMLDRMANGLSPYSDID